MCILEPAPSYFMLAGLFDPKRHMFFVYKYINSWGFSFYIKWKVYLQHAMFSHHFQRYFGSSSSMVVSRIVSDAGFLARGCMLMFPFENYRASAPRRLSDTSKTAVPGLQPRGVSKIHTVKINLRALHPSAGLTLTL